MNTKYLNKIGIELRLIRTKKSLYVQDCKL